MPNTATAESLSGVRNVRFTVQGIISLAWQKARMNNFAQEPTTLQQTKAREWLNVKLDSLQTVARIARSVTFLSTTTVAAQASYTLSSDIFDVINDGAYSDAGSSTDTPMRFMGRDEYLHISNKTAAGRSTRYYPERGSTIVVYPWPVPSIAGDTIKLQQVRWLQEVLTSSNTMDLERYFSEYLIYALAYEIGTSNGIDNEYMRDVLMQAQGADGRSGLLGKVMGYSRQRGPVQLHMSHRTPWSRGRR
jgi:hypothetical protein